MNFLKKLFDLEKPAEQQGKAEAAARAHEKWRKDYEQVAAVLNAAIEKYSAAAACPCAFPRFRQVCGISCIGTGHAFQCQETEVFIRSAKPNFVVETISRSAADVELWTCRHRNSTFHCIWQELGISIDMTFLQVKDLKIKDLGKPTLLPVPLFLGLWGYSMPAPGGDFAKVDFEVFEKYVLEID